MQLRENQKEAISFFVGRKVSLLEASVGFGKTFLLLAYANSNPTKEFIILVHKKGMITQWEKEMDKIFGKQLENVRIFAYSLDLPKKLECDCLVVDEFHFLKSIGKRWRNAKKIKWVKTIWLTATPVDSAIDWYAYLKFMDIMTRKDDFLKTFEAYGHNSIKPDKRYSRYINFQKTPNFKLDGVNEFILEEYIGEFRKVMLDRDVLENIKHTFLSSPRVKSKIFLEKRYELHEITKKDKLKYIKDNFKKAIVIVNYDIEKDFLKEQLPDFTILNYKSAELTGTDGLQKIHSNMIFWTPIPSKLRLIQAIGRIDRKGQEEKVNIVTFVSNRYENQLWNKTLSK